MLKKRSSSKKLDIKKNFKAATDKKELTFDVQSLLAVLTWILPATIFKMSGWSALATSFIATWGLGAIFQKPSMRRAAVALAAVHITYTTLSGTIQTALKTPVWRMGGTETTQLNTVQKQTFPANTVTGLSQYLRREPEFTTRELLPAETLNDYLTPDNSSKILANRASANVNQFPFDSLQSM